MPCGNDPCGCIAVDDSFCGPECRQAVTEQAPEVEPAGSSSLPDVDCICGHAECRRAQGSPVDA